VPHKPKHKKPKKPKKPKKNMATYFVRKTGLDSNDGLTKGAAFLTIDKAANTVAAGDTVHVGAGVYREIVTIDTSGTSGSIILWIADVTGANTDDPGLVIISAYANELSTASRNHCIDLNDGKQWNTFRGFTMTGGTNSALGDQGTTANNNYEGIVVEDCSLIRGHDGNDFCIGIDFNAGTAPTGAGLRVRRCSFMGGGVYMAWNSNASAIVDLDVLIESCVFVGPAQGTTTTAGVRFDQIVGNTFGSGGVTIDNCTFMAVNSAVRVDNGTQTTNPVDVRNSVFINCTTGLNKATSNDGALTSDYNTFLSTQTSYTNVTAGGNDRSNTSDPGLWGGIGDYPLYRFMGWSPYRPGEPIRLQDDAYIHGVIGDANTSDAPAFDLYDEDRPMYGIVDDRGGVEGRARPEQETTTTRTGSNALRFEGAGFHDFIIPVSNQSTTVSIYGRFDSNYTGSKPILEVLNIDGVADQSDIMTGSADTFEELTATFTPTADGVCRVRIRSQDTSATGEAFFDDLTVT